MNINSIPLGVETLKIKKIKTMLIPSLLYLPGLPVAFELHPPCQQYKLPTACQLIQGTPELSVRIFQSPVQTGYSVQATFVFSQPK